jgi:hypothetical protein
MIPCYRTDVILYNWLTSILRFILKCPKEEVIQVFLSKGRNLLGLNIGFWSFLSRYEMGDLRYEIQIQEPRSKKKYGKK